VPELRLPYSRALDALDPEAIVARLAEDVVIVVAVHDEPMAGREVAQFLFAVLSEELRGFHVTDELIEGESAVVLFEAEIRGHAAQGLNVVRLDGAGQVRELTVFFRPLATLQVVSEVIGARMEAQFGAPGTPDG
jgi:hypothetical protein